MARMSAFMRYVEKRPAGPQPQKEKAVSDFRPGELVVLKAYPDMIEDNEDYVGRVAKLASEQPPPCADVLVGGFNIPWPLSALRHADSSPEAVMPSEEAHIELDEETS